ncbi:unnamed protein product [Didymodactylos carnosus]|uniref:FLYWCH-type domain-containing protein n=1 Tax=Didymodactylos carnosus TaxID=1234261 RepID=A0A814KSW7_9BILA|nr:unnamed protein product [Didymodactylos carnosus]CAF3822999.1 unnamed protein product [Didymodactylos carnosus]
MASSSNYNPCSNTSCSKGIGILMCQGCQRIFCRKHSNEHHQELGRELENIAFEHNATQQQLKQLHMNDDKLKKQIDEWEQGAINRIKAVAEKVRNEIQQLLHGNTLILVKRLNEIADEITLRRETEDYLETDLNKWTQQLNETKDKMHKVTDIQIHDDAFCKINMIKVQTRETFDSLQGPMEIKEDGLMAVHCGGDRISSSVYGSNIYSDDIHQISIKVEKMKDNSWMFFGINSLATEIRQNASYSPSAYGWIGSGAREKYVVLMGAGNNTGFNGWNVLMETNKAKLVFMHNGYTYIISKRSRQKTIWARRHNRHSQCRGRLHTINNTVVNEVGEYTHEPSSVDGEVIQAIAA